MPSHHWSNSWRALRRFTAGARQVRRESGIGVIRQAREFWVMFWIIGATPIEFFRYRLWDLSVPRATRLRFVTWRLRQPLEPFLNSRAESQRFASKLQLDDYFRQQGLPTPRRLGVWCPAGVSTEAVDRVDTPNQLMAMVQRSKSGVVFKCNVGMGGQAVLVFTGVMADQLRHASGELWPVERLVERMTGPEPWLVQERVTAHPEIASLSGSDDVASMRMVTCRRGDGSVFLLPVTLKLPSTGEGVDNFSGGNLGVAVNPDGSLGLAALGINGPTVDCHPITGAPFAGMTVPDWDATVSLVMAAQRGLGRSMRSLGWDVALTPDGPMLLEGNPYWAVDVIQQPGLRGLVHGEFREFVEEIGAGPALRTARRV